MEGGGVVDISAIEIHFFILNESEELRDPGVDDGGEKEVVRSLELGRFDVVHVFCPESYYLLNFLFFLFFFFFLFLYVCLWSVLDFYD